MKFLPFCQRISTPFIVVEPVQVSEMPEDIAKRVKALCDIMKLKMDKLERVEIPFVESLFQDIDKVEDIMEKEYNGDVPDYLLHNLSTNLYGQEFASLDADQQSIIKTLSVYICISPFRDNII